MAARASAQELTSRAGDGCRNEDDTESRGVSVEPVGTVASVDFRSVDGVERADGASSLEGELIGSTAEYA